LFPLSSERLLILTNRLWACSPNRAPLEMRPNPDLFRGSMFNFLDVQTRRTLTEDEVLTVNCIAKRRAYRYVAAGREEWLYPEQHIKFSWRDPGDSHLLMPDPRPLHPGAEMVMGYAGGRTEAMDTLGRLPGQADFGLEARSGLEMRAHSAWTEQFEQLVGPERRGLSWEDKTAGRRNAAVQITPESG
jgi:hypothetical protein